MTQDTDRKIAENIRIVRDDAQYSSYLEEIKRLISSAPTKGSAAQERLELLSVVVSNYEDERFLLSSVDPIDAILMRMAERGLEQKDLAQILGSAPRASEILNRKRALSLEQIRLIARELHISADVLLGQNDTKSDFSDEDLKNLPVKEMIKRGWFGTPKEQATVALDQFKEFMARVSLGATPVFTRRSIFGGISDSARMTTFAWLARVILKARQDKLNTPRFHPSALDIDFLKQVAKLSSADLGPKLAQQFLAIKGITLVVERELPGMKLDGAVLRDDDGMPIIGLTLRYDRLDNFWFTLLHELAHLLKHFNNQSVAFVDDLSNIDVTDIRELEADTIASECLIPRSVWTRSSASRSRTKTDIDKLASDLCINPAVVAGRIRKETGNWTILSKLVGQGEVRKHFADIEW
jgi:HTH-type transcriptional regulator / antitoxin HigA